LRSASSACHSRIMSKRAQIGDCFTGAVIADDADEYPFISDPDILEDRFGVPE